MVQGAGFFLALVNTRRARLVKRSKLSGIELSFASMSLSNYTPALAFQWVSPVTQPCDNSTTVTNP